jgi:CheY-like chemotaxis protein
MEKGLIAILDDDDLDRYIYKKIILLTSPGFKVIDFSTGQEALDYLTHNADRKIHLPDIIILDVKMPIVSGWQYLKHYNLLKPILKKHTRHYVCTSSIEQFKDDKKSDDLFGYFRKPLSPEDMRGIIDDTRSGLKAGISKDKM